MFNLLTSRYREIEKALIEDVLDQRQADALSSLLVLSPSGHMLERLQRQLAEKAPSLLNIHFLTFYALAERLLAGASYTERIVTEPAVYQEIIRDILVGEASEPVDRAIREALHTEGKPIPKGLAGALAATMKDLRDAGMRADKALEVAREGFLGKEAPEAASTLALYGRMIGIFEKNELRSSADLLRRAAAAARKHPWLAGQKAIFLYGFYDLTGVQLDLVLSLADHPNAKVYFPYEKGNPAHAYAERLLNDPAFAGKSITPPHPASRGPLPTGEGLIPSPYGRGTASAQGEAKIDLYSCSGARDEVWLAAKEILKLVDEGIPYREIAVVSRNLTPYLPALREIFRGHEIPYTCSRGEPAGSHPLVKTIRTLVTLDEKHPYIRTLRKDLAKSPYLSLSHRERDGKAQGEGSWLSHITWATSLLHQSIRFPKDASDEERSLFEAVIASLDALKILDGLGKPVTRERFLDAWQEKLDLLERPAAANHDGVQALEVQQARGLSFRAVFLLGMNEKVFPRLIREDPFLSDAARGALAQATGCRLGRKLDGYEEERFLFELMRQAASERLFLFTQRSDEEGKARIPSVYLKELEHQAPGLEAIRLPRSTVEKFDRRPPLTWTPKELSFLMNRAQLDPKSPYTALGWDVAGYYRILASHRAIETFRSGLGPYDGVLADATLVRRVLEKGFSPSSLEDLAQCPFQYYAGHVLRIPVEEDLAPEGEMTPQALGQLFHKTLELFYTDCAKPSSPTVSGGGSMDPLPVTAGDDKKLMASVQKAADACFAEFAANLSTVYPLALKASKELVIKELSIFIKSDIEECIHSGYTPRWFEQPIDGTLPSGVLPYRFHGKPDRLDIKGGVGITEIRVIDYKSGKPKPWTGRIETQIIQGRFLQLPIYLGLAGAFAEKELGKKAASTMATLRPVRETDEEATEKSLPASFWQSPSAPMFIENIKELIGVIEKEKFYIEPDTGDWGYCARCNFARICRKEHMPTRLRAEHDPLRQRVVEKLGRTAPSSASPPNPSPYGRGENNPLPSGEGRKAGVRRRK